VAKFLSSLAEPTANNLIRQAAAAEQDADVGVGLH
jgi:hypothetical protein